MDGHAQRTTNRWSMGAAVAILVVAAAVPAANGARPNGRDVTPVPRALHIVIQPQNLVTGALFGVAAASATNAWAVGTTSTDFDARHGAALIEHWNGSTWTQLPSPVGTGSQLSAVTARSANDAWAVGAVANASFVTKPLILHWNGHAWKRVASPAPGHGSGLGGVTALSAHNAWAVGSFRPASPAGCSSNTGTAGPGGSSRPRGCQRASSTQACRASPQRRPATSGRSAR